MIININNKDYELKLTIKAINYLDNIYTLENDFGIKFGLGLDSVLVYLNSLNPNGIFNLIKACLLHYGANKIPNDSLIEDYIYKRFDDNGETLGAELLDFLESQAFSKGKIKAQKLGNLQK